MHFAICTGTYEVTKQAELQVLSQLCLPQQ